MLYRFRPEGRVEWSDFSLGLIPDGARPSVDLDRLAWQTSERVLDEDSLRIALRHGRPSRTGLIVDAGELQVINYPRRIRDTHREGEATRAAYRRELEKLEPLLPGTLEGDDRSRAAVDSSRDEILARADEQVRRALADPPSASLAAHWEQLGGALPDPA